MSDKDKPKKTVVLLGAGASHGSDFQLPLMKGFFDLAGVPRELKQFLGLLYADRDPKDFNLEEVLTHITIALRRIPMWRGNDFLNDMVRVEYPLGMLLWYLEHQLKINANQVCSQHEKLFRTLEPVDSILTLNYDLVADQALAVLERDPADRDRFVRFSRMDKLQFLVGDARLAGGEPMAMMGKELESGFYLKLHGSLDWLYCPNTLCSNSKRFYVLSGEKIKDGQEAGRPCRLCGAGLKSVIVAPSPDKSQALEGRFGIQWNLAMRELSAATRIVVIGMSLAASDSELLWLLRTSGMIRFHPVELDIVNPSESDRDRTLWVFGPSRGSFRRVREYLDLATYVANKPNKVTEFS